MGSSHSRLSFALLTAELEDKLQDWDSSAVSLQMCAADTSGKQYSLDFLGPATHPERLLRHKQIAAAGCQAEGAPPDQVRACWRSGDP